MTTEVKLPDDKVAILRDKKDLTNKEVKKLSKVQLRAGGAVLGLRDFGFDPDDPKTWVQASHLTDDQMDLMDEYQRTCVILRLQSWTLDRPLPANVEEVDDLPLSIYNPLTIAAADIKFGDDDTFEINPDPKAPTPS